MILGDKVDLIASATPIRPIRWPTGPGQQIPCITAIARRLFFDARAIRPRAHLTYHFFWGPRTSSGRSWRCGIQLRPTGRGRTLPQRADGNAGAIRSAPAAGTGSGGLQTPDPGRYQVMNNDFKSQISAFKAVNAEIVTGNMIPPDFATFWSQAAQQTSSPRLSP
jgi:branched-chain amino acid transport system substrate-binding protein